MAEWLRLLRLRKGTWFSSREVYTVQISVLGFRAVESVLLENNVTDSGIQHTSSEVPDLVNQVNAV